MKARLPGGHSGGNGPTNMQGLMKQAQKMQENMETLQADLDVREYEITAGGGVVKVNINGKLEISTIEISPDIVDPDDIETLSDVITAAVNEAIKKVNDTNQEEMNKITGSFSVPGMPGLF